MTTYLLTGSANWAGGGKTGVTVAAYKASRFADAPAFNDPLPDTNAPDAGPVVTTPTFGAPGNWQLTLPDRTDDYWVVGAYGSDLAWNDPGYVASGGLYGWQLYPISTNS